MADEVYEEGDVSTENETKQELSALKEQLAQMTASMQNSQEAFMQAITSMQQSSSKTVEPSYDEYMTAEEKKIAELEAKINDLSQNTTKQTAEMIRKERELDSTVVRLAQQFPEIQSDAAIQKAVVQAHNNLPKSMQDTAEGYELAVSRVVAQKGLMPRSKRTESSSDDYSAPAGKGARSASTKKGSTKVHEKTLMLAQLLGRDIEDPKVIAGLEAASERDSWNKYR